MDRSVLNKLFHESVYGLLTTVDLRGRLVDKVSGEVIPDYVQALGEELCERAVRSILGDAYVSTK